MDSLIIGLGGFAVLFILILLRVPIALAMLGVGFGGGVFLIGWQPMLGKFYADPYYLFSSYSLSVIPLFLLMGHLATKSGLSRSLFEFANNWVGHHRGGLAMATITACAGFSAICGSSVATAATLGPVALPEMRKRHYSVSLATGSLAAGGTLGILIPPSIILILYAILAEQNLIKMFFAALLPGLLAVLGYIATVAIYVRLRPVAVTITRRASWRERIMSIRQVWHIGGIFILVLGGIYGGFFTPTEAAAVGCTAIGLITILSGQLSIEDFLDCLRETAITTAMIYMILLGAAFFSSFLALAQVPVAAVEFIEINDFPPYVVLGAMLVFYLLMGCVMDSLSLVILTLPIFLPAIVGLNFGLSREDTAIWFGILSLVVVEVGLITPPIGLNAFVIRSLDKEVSLAAIFAGIAPFFLSDLIRIILLIVFPSLSLLLVHLVWG